ncbi:DUF2800 domain-containing protein [Lactonifactor sp. BIOML-A3]|uniref:DUF2800 domain-containing protein n=1 Tax=unclassified Lactonifactor TaxID=2636670 RepID=UPI0012AF971C|nr:MULTISPECIES: DUF2800 domain-containing protein [unclassified Lactonifactor]MSA03337.1 DUF2800 domain-containing protein [Lactonifactor sp. BIOML-A5]MSA09686.1 DUF2800 domain-containing protein [Lactonifactor sp. BIOML-A4]MSA14228.1 DUF2800 domain-containing protein [Lactonifactor sp. BIOML-A3]MSA18691.1 DUF2800 domain-containing protein [Lactonifactor sp. BIOML-A2]MSA39473.1 DUF2800 domain-containing protein [Lactonifactor sp. BIOML-A1]
MGAHARFSPSSGSRYLNCPPALLLEEQFEDEQSPYAAEGSAGHRMAEYLINKHLKRRDKRPVSDYYSDELLEAVDDYVAYVIGQIEEAKRICSSPVFAVEQRVDLRWHVKDCFGTADMVIITDKKIQIIDLKLGKGVMVDAEENVQLMIYGLGVLDMADMLFDIETVELTIEQPRLEHFSTWEISAEELRTWGKEVLEPRAKMALSGEGEFKAGDHCRFCKARFQCRARAEELLKLAQMEFKEPDLLTDEEMAEVLSKADDLKKWAEEVYAYAQNEAVVHHKEWPGFKLVMGRSNRKYTDEEEVAEAAKKAGYTDIFKSSLIGITEMERLMGKKKFKEVLGAFVYKPDGKVTLVPDSDKREAVNVSTAEADFKQED